MVTDPPVRADAVGAVARRAEELGWHTVAATASLLPGPAGNVEYFLHLRTDTGGALAGDALDAEIRRAVEEGPQ